MWSYVSNYSLGESVLCQKLNSRMLKEVDAEEVDSLVKVSRISQPLGNRMRERLQNLQDFESLAPESQLKHICERAGCDDGW